MDMERVLNTGPWLFDNLLLVVKQCEVGIEESKEKFHRLGMWVQLWNIPIHLINR
ncbi:hypothetical protein ACH5RR_003401, partial [Cinchona calisaya]